MVTKGRAPERAFEVEGHPRTLWRVSNPGGGGDGWLERMAEAKPGRARVVTVKG